MLFWRRRAPTPSRNEPEVAAAPGYYLVGAMVSHPGNVRTNNEDTVAFALPEPKGAQTGGDALLLVADGMGGHAAGEVASRIAADTVHRCFFATPGRPIHDLLVDCFDTANAEIFTAAQNNPEYAGMGTTCTAIAVRNNHAWLGHVGDSRAYLLRNADFHPISDDHTLVAELVRRGSLTREEAEASPERNVLLKALGTKPQVAPQIWTEGLPLQPDDRLLLCSDGLSDLVTDAMMQELVATRPPLEACHALIAAALAAGGHDNVSVGVFHLTDRGEEDVTATVTDRPTRRPDDVPPAGEADDDATIPDRRIRRGDTPAGGGAV